MQSCQGPLWECFQNTQPEKADQGCRKRGTEEREETHFTGRQILNFIFRPICHVPGPEGPDRPLSLTWKGRKSLTLPSQKPWESWGNPGRPAQKPYQTCRRGSAHIPATASAPRPAVSASTVPGPGALLMLLQPLVVLRPVTATLCQTKGRHTKGLTMPPGRGCGCVAGVVPSWQRTGRDTSPDKHMWPISMFCSRSSAQLTSQPPHQSGWLLLKRQTMVPSAGEDMQTQGSPTGLLNVKQCSRALKIAQWSLETLNVERPCDPAIPFQRV